MTWWHWLWVHLLQETGTTSSASRSYNFLSGAGSDVGELAIIGGLVQMYRKHVCHVDGCYRLSKHPVAGTPYLACRKHHPTVPDIITAAHVAHAHARAKKEGRA
jgi:hypothetical protein